MDDELAGYDSNVQGKTSLDVDYSKCKGSCRMKVVWVALHNSPAELYVYCVNLGRDGTASASIPTTAAAATAPPADTGRPAIHACKPTRRLR